MKPLLAGALLASSLAYGQDIDYCSNSSGSVVDPLHCHVAIAPNFSVIRPSDDGQVRNPIYIHSAGLPVFQRRFSSTQANLGVSYRNDAEEAGLFGLGREGTAHTLLAGGKIASDIFSLSGQGGYTFSQAPVYALDVEGRVTHPSVPLGAHALYRSGEERFEGGFLLDDLAGYYLEGRVVVLGNNVGGYARVRVPLFEELHLGAEGSYGQGMLPYAQINFDFRLGVVHDDISEKRAEKKKKDQYVVNTCPAIQGIPSLQVHIGKTNLEKLVKPYSVDGDGDALIYTFSSPLSVEDGVVTVNELGTYDFSVEVHDGDVSCPQARTTFTLEAICDDENFDGICDSSGVDLDNRLGLRLHVVPSTYDQERYDIAAELPYIGVPGFAASFFVGPNLGLRGADLQFSRVTGLYGQNIRENFESIDVYIQDMDTFQPVGSTFDEFMRYCQDRAMGIRRYEVILPDGTSIVPENKVILVDYDIFPTRRILLPFSNEEEAREAYESVKDGKTIGVEVGARIPREMFGDFAVGDSLDLVVASTRGSLFSELENSVYVNINMPEGIVSDHYHGAIVRSPSGVLFPARFLWDDEEKPTLVSLEDSLDNGTLHLHGSVFDSGFHSSGINSITLFYPNSEGTQKVSLFDVPVSDGVSLDQREVSLDSAVDFEGEGISCYRLQICDFSGNTLTVDRNFIGGDSCEVEKPRSSCFQHYFGLSLYTHGVASTAEVLIDQVLEEGREETLDKWEPW